MAPRTPLVRPDRFFAERELHALRLLLVVVVLTFSLPLAGYGVGWVLTDRIDGTVMVDNPNRPSDNYCEVASGDMASGCDEPERVERNIDALLWDAIEELAGIMIVAFPLALFVVGTFLHAGSWLLGGDNGVLESFAVAAWGMVPSLLSIVGFFVVFALTFEPVTVSSATDPEALVSQVRTQLRPVETASLVFAAVTAVWSAVIWTYGLGYERGLSRGAAAGVAGGVAVLYFLGSLL
jgi:hypothetical protein